MTYSLTRFAIYETARDHLARDSQGPLPFHQKVLLGAISGEQGTEPGGAGGAGIEPGTAASVIPDSAVPSLSGFIGGFMGTPADMVNVRSVCAPHRRGAQALHSP